MHVISRPKLNSFSQIHADAEGALDSWYKVAKKASWKSLVDVQKNFSSAESVGNFTVFNIKGNHYRLVVDILYGAQIIFIKYVLTHAEYDKDKWKNDPHF